MKRMELDGSYKENGGESHSSYIGVDFNMEKEKYIFDPTDQLIPENVRQNNLTVDLNSLFECFQQAVSDNSTDDIEFTLMDLVNNLETFQLEENSFEYLLNSDLILQIVELLFNSPNDNIFQFTVQLILSLYSISFKHKKPEIFELVNSFNDFNILNFILEKINPEIGQNLEKKIDLLTIDMNLLPYYLHLLSYYCLMSDEEDRNLIITGVIRPNFDFFFNSFEDYEMTSKASFLIYSSTKYQFNNDQTEYVNLIAHFLFENLEKMESNTLNFFIKSIDNLTQNEESFVDFLLDSNFDELLEKYINKEFVDIDDKILKIILILKIKLLNRNPEEIAVSYSKLIDIENSKFKLSAKIAFDLFRAALELRNDNPFDDDELFEYFVNSLKNGKFDVKSEFVALFDVWIVKSNDKSVLNRANIVLEEIINFLPQVDVTDILCEIILNEIKGLIEIASKSSTEDLMGLKNTFENNDGIDIVAGIHDDNESPESVYRICEIILSYWDPEE